MQKKTESGRESCTFQSSSAQRPLIQTLVKVSFSNDQTHFSSDKDFGNNQNTSSRHRPVPPFRPEVPLLRSQVFSPFSFLTKQSSQKKKRRFLTVTLNLNDAKSLLAADRDLWTKWGYDFLTPISAVGTLPLSTSFLQRPNRVRKRHLFRNVTSVQTFYLPLSGFFFAPPKSSLTVRNDTFFDPRGSPESKPSEKKSKSGKKAKKNTERPRPKMCRFLTVKLDLADPKKT